MSQFAIEASNVVKQFSGHRALDEVSVQVPKKGIYGLLGPNGAGKTTLIRIMNQITAPDTGGITFNGQPLVREHVAKIGYLPEERGLYKKMKVGEQALYLARLKGLSAADAKSKLKSWFERFGIDQWWNKKVEELSKGMAQKVQFITTVMHEPELLILDEPFSGFDPINVELIRNEILRLKDEGATVILSTHNMGSVEELCDEISLINKAKVILNGTVDQIKKDFSKRTYELNLTGQLIAFTNDLWTNFELVEKESEGDSHKCTIQLLGDSTVNDLLSVAIKHVQVHSVNELIPSMHDIFIEVVNSENESNG